MFFKLQCTRCGATASGEFRPDGLKVQELFIRMARTMTVVRLSEGTPMSVGFVCEACVENILVDVTMIGEKL